MRRAFAAVTEVVSAAEQVWTEVTGHLDAVGAELARVTPQATALEATRRWSATWPLPRASWSGCVTRLTPIRWPCGSVALGRAARRSVDTSGAVRLQEQVGAAATRVDELVRLRDDARQRIAEVTTAAATARSAREDAAAAWQQAAAKIATVALPPEPADLADLSGSAGRPGYAAGWRPVDPPGV